MTRYRRNNRPASRVILLFCIIKGSIVVATPLPRELVRNAYCVPLYYSGRKFMIPSNNVINGRQTKATPQPPDANYGVQELSIVGRLDSLFLATFYRGHQIPFCRTRFQQSGYISICIYLYCLLCIVSIMLICGHNLLVPSYCCYIVFVFDSEAV